MKILVTGGAGFIGTNLLESLQGHDLTVYDTFETAGLNERKEDAKKTVKERAELCTDISRVEPDTIIHLGMSSSSPMYKDNKDCVTTSINTTLKVLEIARNLNIPVVYASSSSLYNGNVPPFKEDANVRITDFYTETRFMVERLMQLYSNLYGIRTVGLRLFSVYGEHDKYKGKFANMMTQFKEEEKTGNSSVVFGDGKQSRDFVHVSDIVEAFKLAMNYKKTDIFNVGTGREASFNEILEIIGQDNVKYVENPIKNYVQRTWADTTKAEKLLEFKFKIPLEKGIEMY